MPTTRPRSKPIGGGRRSVVERDLPPGVYRTRAKGRDYWYYQPGKGTARAAKAKPIPGTPETPEFWEFIAEIRAGSGGMTLSDVAALWTRSAEFLGLSENTQDHYRHYIGAMFKAGLEGKAFARIERADLMRLRSSYGDKRVAANHAMTTARELWNWAITQEYVATNPAADNPRYDVEHEGSEPWPDWAIDLVLEQGDWPFRFGVAAMAYTGQRGGDCVAMRKADFNLDRNRVQVTQEKTRKPLIIPIHLRFRPIVEEGFAREPEFLIPRRCGLKPSSAGAFRAYFGRQIKRREFRPILEAQLSLHGLRKWATCSLLEVGCTTAEAAAITGHSLAIIELYARRRNQRLLAEAEMEKWSGAA